MKKYDKITEKEYARQRAKIYGRPFDRKEKSVTQFLDESAKELEQWMAGKQRIREIKQGKRFFKELYSR